MKKYIDANKFIDAVKRLDTLDDEVPNAVFVIDVIQAIYEAPAANVQDVRCLTPCDVCKYNPPSSGDGKPCLLCPACKY